jgi:dihydrofolate synthase / folylpolyglutamate synthase
MDKKFEWFDAGYKADAKMGLDHLKPMLSIMGNPHQKLSCIHVAGTNGKGSTCRFLNHILLEAGYRTGLFTSPYLEKQNEQIHVNGKDIPDEDFEDLAKEAQIYLKKMQEEGLSLPSSFEVLTAMAFFYFLKRGCDLVILEVGLGGLLDATNVIPAPLVAAFTPIDYDHMQVLGHSLEEIATHKAGIIKEGTRVVSAPQRLEVKEVLERACRENNVPYTWVDEAQVVRGAFFEFYQTFSYMKWVDLKIPMLGKHQRLNASLAIEVVRILSKEGYAIESEAIQNGLCKTTWPGRFELLRKNPMVIIDAAHNEDGARALYQTLKEHFMGYKKIILVGLLQDKEIDKVIPHLLEDTEVVIATMPISERALSAQELSERIKAYLEKEEQKTRVYTYPDWKEGVNASLRFKEELGSNKSLICACGSLYLIGEVRRYLQTLP